MKVSKHSHSCLLIEESGTTVLVDPGSYTEQDQSLNLNPISNLDYLLITHEHPDHFYLPLVEKIVAKFPTVKIMTNPSVGQQLAEKNINYSLESDDKISVTNVKHALMFGQQADNTIFKIFDRLTHPGDTHNVALTREILALPIQAPWGSYQDAVNLAIKLKPKIVVPIHDWHWREEARKAFYARTKDMLSKQGIGFVEIENNQEVEV